MAEKEERTKTRSTDEFASHEPKMTKFSPDFSPIDEPKPKPVRTGQRGKRGVDEWGNPHSDDDDEQFWANIRSDAEEGGFGAGGTVAARKAASRPAGREPEPTSQDRSSDAARPAQRQGPRRSRPTVDPTAATVQAPLPQRPAKPAPAAASAGLADLVEPSPQRPAQSAAEVADQRTVTFSAPTSDVMSILGAGAQPVPSPRPDPLTSGSLPAQTASPEPARGSRSSAAGSRSSATGGSRSSASGRGSRSGMSVSGSGSRSAAAAGSGSRSSAPGGASRSAASASGSGSRGASSVPGGGSRSGGPVPGSGSFPAVDPASSGSFPAVPAAPISGAPTSDPFPAAGPLDASWPAQPAATSSGSWPATPSPDILDDPAPAGPSGSWPGFQEQQQPYRASYEVRPGWAVADDSDPLSAPSPATPARPAPVYDDVLSAPTPTPQPIAYETGDFANPAVTQPAQPAWPAPPAGAGYGDSYGANDARTTGGHRRTTTPEQEFPDYYR